MITLEIADDEREPDGPGGCAVLVLLACLILAVGVAAAAIGGADRPEPTGPETVESRR